MIATTRTSPIFVWVRALLLLATLALPATAAWGGGTRAISADKVAVYLFWSQGCPHCLKARTYLQSLTARAPHIELHAFELGTNETHDRMFVALSRGQGIAPPAVPLVVIGDTVFAGFDSDATTGAEFDRAIAHCREADCPDLMAQAFVDGPRAAEKMLPQDGGKSAKAPALPKSVWLPVFGEIETRSLSLPVLTVVLGFVDGFNPCAMWVLVFLIGLLVGMKDPVRMWTYGAVFLLTSALVYLAFMAAWLNVLMILGSLVFIRIGIGVFALAAAGYYLWQFWSNPDAACPVTTSGERQRVMTRLREVVAERSFLVAVAGIVVLAALVNLIELLCSAGIPAIYTQVLALSDLSGAGYGAYLLLYITVFLIDDLIVFVTAMLTLRATGLAATYSRYSHLLGGIVLGGIGLMLLFRPQWLVFA
jgi:thiol-disulfide isomerase/thioredoxin